ncbi:MAG: hypothetical protein ACRDL8_14735, partial [Solirubrobacteraceae bacterium]
MTAGEWARTRGVEAIVTARMRGEPLGPGHERELATLMLDPRVGRTLWATPTPPTMAEIRQGLRDKRAHWDRHGFGLW